MNRKTAYHGIQKEMNCFKLRLAIFESLFSFISKLQTETQAAVDIWVTYRFS